MVVNMNAETKLKIIKKIIETSILCNISYKICYEHILKIINDELEDG